MRSHLPAEDWALSALCAAATFVFVAWAPAAVGFTFAAAVACAWCAWLERTEG